MDDEGEALRRIGVQKHSRSLDGGAGHEARQFADDQVFEAGTLPVGFHQQCVGIGEGKQSSREGPARLIERLAAGQALFGDRLDQRQEVVGAVLQLTAQKLLALLGPFALCDVNEGDDDALDSVLRRAVRPDTHDEHLLAALESKVALDDGSVR